MVAEQKHHRWLSLCSAGWQVHSANTYTDPYTDPYTDTYTDPYTDTYTDPYTELILILN